MHPVAIAGSNHDQILAVILHQLEKCLDRFPAEILIGVLGRKAVCLVDEQHSSDRFLHDRIRLDRGLTDEPRDQLGTIDLDQMPFREEAERVEYLAQQPGDCRLAGSWRTDEYHMVSSRRNLQSLLPSHLAHASHVDEALDLELHR